MIIVTVGEAFSNMTTRAYDALSTVGIDIGDVAQKGQTFAAFISFGSHCKTMYELYTDDLASLDLHLQGNSFMNE